MVFCKRALLLGVVAWLIPFAAGFVVFPIKQTNAQLFNSIMALAVVLTAAALLILYFRDRQVNVREAGIVGAMWVVMNLVLDYPMFAFGPMQMTAAQYYSEIGLEYLIYPIVAIGAAKLARAENRLLVRQAVPPAE